jgi:hypothetical protein
MGKEFLKIRFSDVAEKKQSILYGIVIPWLLGTGLVIVTYLPLPQYFILGIISSSAFGIFAVIGAIKSRARAGANEEIETSFQWIDCIFVLVPILAVRILITGISFTP